MRRMLACVVLAACGTPSAPITQAPAPAAPPGPSVPFTSDVVVIKVSRVAGRTPASPRVLRRIVASRRGNVELMMGYSEVGLVVTEVVSGKLFDPDYAKRPVGVNHLEVVLVDEAAYAAPLMEDNVEGTWKLTQLADGTLVASSIDDTPWPASLVAGRRIAIAQARKDLRSPLPEQRMAGLDVLEKHAYYELVPDVIAILDDDRTHGRPVPPPGHGGVRVVGEVAEQRLRRLTSVLGDVLPSRPSPDAWTAFWRDHTLQVASISPLAETERVEHIRLATYQSWPVFARTAHGVAVGVTRLETPLDGNTDGVFLVKAQKRTWLSRIECDALDAADNGVLYAETGSSWLFKLVDGKPRAGAVFGRNARATYNVLARSTDGFLVLGIDDSKDLLATFLDNEGKPRIETRLLPLNAYSESKYHRGVRPLGVARRPRGWLAVAATENGMVSADITDGLQLVSTTPLATARGIMEPAIVVGSRSAFAVWTNGLDVIEHVVLDLAGKPITPVTHTGSEVNRVSAPVALDDGGFAAAWIEARTELHIGRWDAKGARVANVIVQQRHVAPFTVQLQREGTALVVTYLDLSRYPYPLVSRRLPLADLR